MTVVGVTRRAGRIDFEQYQFRPVLKPVQAAVLESSFLISAGKTTEACLVPKDPQARKRAMIFSKRLVIDGMWRNERKRLDEDSRTWTTAPGIAAR